MIITLSDIKTTKGAFTYYLITEGRNAYAWLWGGGGWPRDDRRWVFCWHVDIILGEMVT